MCGCGRKPKCNFKTGLQRSHGPGGGGMPGATSLEREAEVLLQVWEWWFLKFDLPLRTLGTPHVAPCTMATLMSNRSPFAVMPFRFPGLMWVDDTIVILERGATRPI